MADFVDPCCVASTMAVQLTKPDKNNNTTANLDDGIILPSEQCDVIEDGMEDKSDSTGDCDDRHVSSGADDDGTSNSTPAAAAAAAAPSVSTTDVQPVPISSSYSNNPNNNSSNNTSTNTPMPTSNSDPYKDFSGVDTESFISTTLRNNPKDRLLLLRLEAVLQQFIQDGEKTSHQFQAMNSYERMIVHRVAAFFGLDHNVDKNGQAVVVTKTSNTRIPDFSFQKCIPEGESTDPNPGAFAADASLLANSVAHSNPTDIPARRILRRHEKTSSHEHSTRNGLNDEHSHLHSSSTSSNNKHSSMHKPYSERMNNYAETRARIFNETPNTHPDGSNATASTMNNKTQKSNGKGNAQFGRASYRKSQPTHHPNQQRSYLYPHAQTTTNNHLQAFATGKPIDPSSHLINPVAGRAPLYSSHPMGTPNLSMAQAASLYGPMVTSNPNAGPIRVQVPGPFYPPGQQPPLDYDYKQSLAGAHIYNYVSMIPQPASTFLHPQSQVQQQQQQSGQVQAPGQTQGLTSVTSNNPNQVPSQHGTSIQLPILLHQQPSGQIQYLFPAQALQQQQQQAQQTGPPSSANPYPLTPDGQYVQVYRSDGLSIAGAGPAVLENNPNHHHAHHHAYPPTPSYHHHPGHPLSQAQQVPPQNQQPQQGPLQAQGTGPGVSQSNLATQPGSYMRLYPSATPANLSHPYPQTTYATGAPPPPGSFVQPGTLPPGSYMIPPQTPGAVPPYPTFDNGSPYPTAYAPPSAPNNTGKNGMNNAQAPPPSSVHYATNHLSNLTLQATQHDDYQARLMTNNPNPRYTHPNGSTNNHIAATGTGAGGPPRNFIGRPLVQSPNGTSPTPRMTMYPPSNHPYRPARPYNLASTDKTMPSVNENDPKTTSSNQPTPNTSESISLAGPAQE